jgi:hypothetical protein
MAEYERRGAELERRWGALTEPNTAHSGLRAAELARKRTRESAGQASRLLTLLAKSLERSARLAEELTRIEQTGSGEGAAPDGEVANRAREEAQRVRRQAEAWLKASENPNQ